MTYAELLASVASILVVDTTDSDLLAFFPRIIETAELRCYREVDFLATRKAATATLTQGTYTMAGPSDWLVGRHMYATPQSGAATRITLLRREESFLSEYWPTRATQGVPKYWSEPTIGQLQIVPTANAAFTLEMAYTYRPAALSVTNTSSWLSANVPDMLMYAAFVTAAGYAKNYGMRSDDPQQAVSWEQSYQQAKASAVMEELRRKVTDPTPAQNPATA